MKVEKSGSFIGVSIVKDKSEIYPVAYIRFKNGVFSAAICEGITISSLIEKYNLGVANMGVRFSYTDYSKMVYFDCYIWDCEENILQDMTAELDGDTKQFISDLLGDVQPNFKVDNIMSASMNGLSIVDDAPAGLKKETDFNTDGWMTPGFGDKLRSMAKIHLDENVVVYYHNSWNNEGCYGPQGYGGFSQISENYTDSGSSHYDFQLNEEDENMVWDENTVISLEGNQYNGIHISCCLKNIGMFKGIIDSTAVNSCISSDVKELMDVEYITHLDYIKKSSDSFINLVSVKRIFEFFKKYQDVIYEMRHYLLDGADKMKGEHYIEKDDGFIDINDLPPDDLPFL